MYLQPMTVLAYHLAVKAKADARLRRALTAALWKLKEPDRLNCERAFYKFMKSWYKEVGKTASEKLLAVYSGPITSVDSAMAFLQSAIQEEARAQRPELEKLYAQRGKVLLEVHFEQLEALIEGIRRLWEKKGFKKAAPPTIDYSLVENINAELHGGYYKEQSSLLSGRASEQVVSQVERAVAEGAKRGADSREVAGLIEKYTGGAYSDWRALRVARTETNSLMNHTNFDIMGKSGVVETKTWLAMSDQKTRDAHAQADGQEVSLNKPFDVGGAEMMYPGDEAGGPENVIHCRCDMIGGVSEEYLPAGTTYDQALEAAVSAIGGEGAIVEGEAIAEAEEAIEGGIRVSKEYQEDVRKLVEEKWENLARINNTSVEQIKAEAIKEVEKLLKDSRLAVRVDSRVFIDNILKDGRFKSQFETTATGGGFKDRETMAKIEQRLFGYSPTLKPEMRPIYGHLFSKGTAWNAKVDSYGDLEVILKDSVRKRTSWTGGDSLVNYYPKGADRYVMDEKRWTATAPTALEGKADLVSLNPRQYGIWKMENGARKIEELGAFYSEAQVHGGLKLADVAEIRVKPGTSPFTKADLAKLKEAGIKVRGLEPEALAKVETAV